MLGVSAMAVQNALVQVSLKGAPSTAVMTTNVTRFTSPFIGVPWLLVVSRVLDPKSCNAGRMVTPMLERTAIVETAA